MQLCKLEGGSYFYMPWREVGAFGRLMYVSDGSARVYVPKGGDDEGFEYLHVSRNTEVEPATAEQYNTQLLTHTQTEVKKPRNRSAVESPVQLVHRLCNEMLGQETNPTKEERDALFSACVEQGVNIHTAKTQYYHWRKM